MNTYGLSSHEYMARQFNFHQGLNLPANQYLFNGIRRLTRPAGQRDTAVYVAPNRLNGAKFHGTREFKYWRHDLSIITEKEYLLPNGFVPTSKAQLLQFINTEHGLNLEARDIVDTPINSFVTPFNTTFQINPASLLYTGSFTAKFSYSVDQLLPVRILDGFVYPDTDGETLPDSQILPYLTHQPDVYWAKTAKKNEELSIWMAVATDQANGQHVIDFGACLNQTQRISTLLNNYRITITIDQLNNQMDRKLFLKESGADLKGPGWYSAFNDDEIVLNDLNELPTLARGKFVLPSGNSNAVIKITAKPMRVVWIPSIEVEILVTR